MASIINSPLTPNLVWAARPIFGGHVQLLCHPQTIEQTLALGSNAKMGEYWGLVHGNPGAPPSGFPDVETDGLKRPDAIFRGLRRPLHYLGDNADRDIFVYVTNPAETYEFHSSSDGGALLPKPAPLESVFTTFVSFNTDHIDEALTSVEKRPGERPAGVILFWEWTESARNNRRLPYGFEARYDTRMQ